MKDSVLPMADAGTEQGACPLRDGIEIIQPQLSDDECQKVLFDWNATEMPFPADKCAHQLLEEQCRKTPDATAVIYGDKTLTYMELHQRANALAVRLQNLGARPDDRIAILAERSLEMMIGLLAIWKSGAAYVPLDPTYPQERLTYMLQDSGAKVLLKYGAENFEANPAGVQVIRLEEANESLAYAPVTSVSSGNLAYVIYTSGSTGQPKGVMLTHRNVSNFFVAMDRELGAEPGTWLAVTSISFDISVLELFWTLARGFKVVIQPGGTSTLAAASGMTVPEQIIRHEVTHFQCTPSLLKGLLGDSSAEAAIRRLKRLLLGGEALPVSLVGQLCETSPNGVFNMYGPTETTVWSTVQHIQRGDTQVSIGHPIANTEVYVLSETLQPLPIGEVGELYIGGEGVARGYLNREALTAERFLPHPFLAGDSRRIYRTGDLARWLENGTLQCLGRVDNQVKIRGQRIELGEIETVLQRTQGIAEAVVIARADDGKEPQLVAYLVKSMDAAPTIVDLKRALKEILSEAMIPSVYLFLDKLPLTPNGKIDRKALPKPEKATVISKPASLASGSAMENRIITIWAELLGVSASEIGLHDNFFDLGGHSLLVVQMQAKLKEQLGADMPLAKLFQYTTPSSLAAHLGGSKGQTMNAVLQRGKMKQRGLQARQRDEVTV
ncbi:MAG TPA: non-ribosomal peptide synthetase [Verrucomicrobiae bacterium]